MKTRGLFLSALMMGAIFVGCSSSEDEVLNNAPEAKAKAGDNYIAINIVAPGNTGSRATAGRFEAGTPAENAVSKALFVFYDASGNFVEAVSAKPEELEPWTAGGADSSIEKVSTATIVLSNPSSAPKSVVALLNTNLTETSIGKLSLAQLKATVGDYSSTTSFVMSNSVYQDQDGNEVLAAPLTDANIRSSEDLAKQNPVTVTVERVLAKVGAEVSSNLAVTGKDVELDNQDVKLVPHITGFKVIATNPSSYLIKNLDDYSAFTWNWNDPSNFRSYWAKSAAASVTYFPYTAMKPVADYSEYCQENTGTTKTQLLVSAEIKAEGNNGAAVTILKYKGLYYTTNGLITKVNEMLADYKYEVSSDEGTGTSNNWAPYLDIVDAGEGKKPWEVKVQLKANAPQVAGVADLVNSLDTAAQWTDGKAYFFVPIEHFGDSPQNVGVVRNHYYNLAINSITGLGTPVYNPSETIIPEKMVDEDYYVAAQIQILKWKMVSQEVALN